MTKTFRPYSLDQQLRLPPDMRGWLPEGDLALFVSDVVDELDLSAIYAGYETRKAGGAHAASLGLSCLQGGRTRRSWSPP